MLALWRTAQTGSFPRISLLKCTTKYSLEAVLTSSVRLSSGLSTQIAVAPSTFEVDLLNLIEMWRLNVSEFMLALHVTSSGTAEEKLGWAFKMLELKTLSRNSLNFNPAGTILTGTGQLISTSWRGLPLCKRFLPDIPLRTIFAVYEMVGSKADQSKAEELFNRLDLNSDGSISQDEFITIIKQDHNLLNVLQKVPWSCVDSNWKFYKNDYPC